MKKHKTPIDLIFKRHNELVSNRKSHLLNTDWNTTCLMRRYAAQQSKAFYNWMESECWAELIT